MIPTKQNVLDAVRFNLGDDQVAGGQVFTNTILEQPFQMSLRELYRALQGLANPRVQREGFYDLPINTNYLLPATAGITDLGEVELVEERGISSTFSISAAVAGSGFVTISTNVPHGFTTGNYIVVYGVGGMLGVTGSWGITVVDATNFKLNGAVGTGTYTSGGTATKSTEQWVQLARLDRIAEVLLAQSTLQAYAWFEDAFHFPIASAIRELRITYISSASIVSGTSDSTGVDDSLDFLALRTAALAASSRGARDRAAELNVMAVGPSGQADGSGGVLRELVAAGVRALQANPVRRPPFREHIPWDLSNFL